MRGIISFLFSFYLLAFLGFGELLHNFSHHIEDEHLSKHHHHGTECFFKSHHHQDELPNSLQDPDCLLKSYLSLNQFQSLKKERVYSLKKAKSLYQITLTSYFLSLKSFNRHLKKSRAPPREHV